MFQIKIKKLEKEIDDKNEQVSDLEEKLVNLDLQRNNDLKRIAELQLECEQLKLKQNSPNNKKCSKVSIKCSVKKLEKKIRFKLMQILLFSGNVCFFTLLIVTTIF